MTNDLMYKRVRSHLMRYRPFCWYCGDRVVFFHVEGGGALPPNFATIEHLHSATVRQRSPRTRSLDRTLVLACTDCNQLRGYWDDCILHQPEREYAAWLRDYLGLKPRKRVPGQGPPAVQRLHEYLNGPSSREYEPG